MKLRFGKVSWVVLQILHREQVPMRLIEIHQGVEQPLGFPVHRGSVKGFLSAEASHRRPRFVRVGHGRYQAI